jgi:hypothetical protein
MIRLRLSGALITLAVEMFCSNRATPGGDGNQGAALMLR